MKLMQGGDLNSAIGQLMGAGDIEGAKTMVGLYRAQHPVIDPYQAAQLQLGQDRLTEAGKTSTQKDYEWAYGAGAQPGTQSPTGAKVPTPAEFIAHKKDKPLPPRGVMENKAEIIGSGLDAMTGNIDELLKPENRDAFNRITGFTGDLWQIPGSKEKDLQVKLDQLKDQAKLAAFQDLKDASTSGTAGFGRLAVVEFNSMSQRIAALNAAQSPLAIAAALTNLKDWASGVKERMRRGIEADYGPMESQTKTDTQLNAPPVPGAMQPIQKDPRGPYLPPSGGVVDYKDYFGQ